MIDLHCHILPGVDDGPETLADSLAMAKMATQEGIHTIVATPHHLNSTYTNPRWSILNKVEELNNALKQENIDITILPGQETRIYGEMIQGINEDDILTVASSPYVLVEFPSNSVPRYTEQLFFDLQLKGFIPVIVHPERNQELIENPDILYQLVKKGALTQVTAASIAGAFGKKIKNFSLQLVEANLTHFIASDAHNVSNRSFKLKEAYSIIRSKYGSDVEFMFKENAALIIEGKHAYKEAPERVKKKKFLNIF
ncbi:MULTISPECIES: tyrosine-protein phosphatase [unclassified Bacillus (in: firmicutes)]|uniref:tyrosine-protein phosphatase n=1 Tax=unclassified Bacillus (in: firmicutes) TaxID=185979 RepID=UPI0008EC8DF2|nr:MULTISPECIES: CpsB/CapC family capsule biosynthesis tyrosine phosphatase [unclassified Bacillus (in: firmicutes)]SFB04622.1 protein-tyrosine phosphatase [Bacillus sp. UNCCL13]SFQ88465.1 protein-tyrosine phosphatase [Bacillus sp. cl95]